MNNHNNQIIVACMVLFLIGATLAEPNGAGSVTEVTSSSASASAASNKSSIAGNITDLIVSGLSTTQAWQGYTGNITGSIRLADSSGNNLYNWSLNSPQGEVFASTSNSVTWSSIACFNLTANATGLETDFGISPGDADGVNETFSDANAHDAFNVGATAFSSDECPATFIFDDSGQGVDNSFEEVLLTDETNAVFAAILEEDVLGYDGLTHDFEMLVLEDGHSGNTSTTPYYFYTEVG